MTKMSKCHFGTLYVIRWTFLVHNKIIEKRKFLLNTNENRQLINTGKYPPTKPPVKLPSFDPFESDDIESVLAEAKEMVRPIKPISRLSGKFSLAIQSHSTTKKANKKKLKKKKIDINNINFYRL